MIVTNNISQEVNQQVKQQIPQWIFLFFLDEHFAVNFNLNLLFLMNHSKTVINAQHGNMILWYHEKQKEKQFPVVASQSHVLAHSNMALNFEPIQISAC